MDGSEVGPDLRQLSESLDEDVGGQDDDTDAVKEDAAGVVDEEYLMAGDGVLGEVQHQYEETVQQIVDNDKRVEYREFFECDQISPGPMAVYFQFPRRPIYLSPLSLPPPPRDF